jgi:hypothetical protein
MHQVYSQSEYWNRPCCLMTRAFLTHQYRDLLGGQQEHSEAYNCCNVVRNASSCGSSPCSLLMLSILSATKPTTVPCCWLLPNAATPSIDSESCLDATYTSCSIGALPIDVGISPDSEFDPRLLVDVPISSNQYQSVPISTNQFQYHQYMLLKLLLLLAALQQELIQVRQVGLEDRMWNAAGNCIPSKITTQLYYCIRAISTVLSSITITHTVLASTSSHLMLRAVFPTGCCHRGF